MIFPYGGMCLSIDRPHLRYHFETCTFIQFEFMAKIGLQSALNFILSMMISQTCPNRVYSQLICSWVIFVILAINLKLSLISISFDLLLPNLILKTDIIFIQ